MFKARSKSNRGKNTIGRLPAKVFSAIAISAFTLAITACPGEGRPQSGGGQDHAPVPTATARPEAQEPEREEPAPEKVVGAPPRGGVEEPEPAAARPPPKLTPYQRREELVDSRKRLLAKLPGLRGKVGARYKEAMRHIRESRFSDGTKMYGGAGSIIARRYSEDRNFPRIFVIEISKMHNTAELMKTAPETAVALVHSVLHPKRMEKIYEVEMTKESAEQLAGFFVSFFKATNPTDAQGLDRKIRKTMHDFEGSLKGPSDYAGWKASGVTNVVTVESARKFFAECATFGRLEEFGIGPADPRDAEQRVGFRRALDRKLGR